MVGLNRKWLLGVPVDLVTMREAVEICLSRVADPEGPPLRVLTLNPEMLMAARTDDELAVCFQGETMVVPDGTGILIAGVRRGWRGLHRIPGIDLLMHLVEEAALRSLPIFLYGGQPGVAESAAAVLTERFPGLVIGGTAHGFLTPDEASALPARVAAVNARFIFAALGVPRQEIWLQRNVAATGVSVGMGVGGSFDIIAGRVRRAPLFIRRLGLEWMFRVCLEPHRWRRLLILPRFLWRALRPEKRGGKDVS